ncbi:MAG: hypothetical protein ACOH2D_17230 [Gelidibacter sp.]
MQSKTNEQALESTIEKQLTGTTLETIKSNVYLLKGSMNLAKSIVAFNKTYKAICQTVRDGEVGRFRSNGVNEG